MLKIFYAWQCALHNRMQAILPKFFGSIRGATSIEYGLIAGGIAIAIVVLVFLTGDSLEDLYGNISNLVGGAVAAMG